MKGYHCCILIYLLNVFITSESRDYSETGCTLEPYASKSSSQDILIKLENQFNKRYTFDQNGFQYDMAFCASVSKTHQMATISRTNIAQNHVDVLALRNRTKLVAEAENTYMLQFCGNALDNKQVLKGCQNITSTLFILCDPSSEQGLFRYVGEDEVYCSFTFELKLASVCKPHEMSSWKIFFLLLLMAFLIYFLTGFAYMTFVVGAQGIEQIPNRTLWVGIGGGIANLVDTICRCDRYCQHPEGPVYSDYDPIGGTVGGNSPINQDTGLLHP